MMVRRRRRGNWFTNGGVGERGGVGEEDEAEE